MAKIVRVDEIKSINWSPELDLEGQIVENVLDIEQCIKIILTTPAGSDPHRPTFASNVQDYVDRPQNIATPLLIRDINDSIVKWERRIDVNKVTVDFLPDEPARIQVDIEWLLKNSTFGQVTTVIL